MLYYAPLFGEQHLLLKTREWMSAKNKNLDEEKINILISERLEAKKIKDFERADQIRQELLDMNIEIKDGPQGTEWSIK